MTTDDLMWGVTYASSRRDLELEFAGDREAIIKQVELLGRSRGWEVEVDAFTDQVDAWRVSHGRRRRWLILMP